MIEVPCPGLPDSWKKLIDNQHGPDGCNIGANIGSIAGRSVMQCHIHVIPRYAGDTGHPRGGVRGVTPHKGNY